MLNDGNSTTMRTALVTLLLATPSALAVSRLDNPSWASSTVRAKADDDANLQAYLNKYAHRHHGARGDQQCLQGGS